MQCSLCERPSGYTVECSATDCHLRVHVGCASHHDLHPRARIVRAAIATGGEVLFVEKLVKIVTCPEHSAAADVEAILDREQKLFQAEEERRAKSSHDLPLPKKKTSKLKRSSSSPAVSEASILLSRRARGVTKHHGKPSRTISTPHSQVRGVKLIWSKYERYFTRLFQKTPPDLSSTQVRVLEAEGRAVLALLTDQIPCFTGAACPPSYPGFDMSMAFEFLTRGGIRPCLLLGKGVGALCRFQFSPCDQVDEETGLRPQELALMCRKIPRWKDVIQVLQQQFSGRVPGASRTPGSHLVLSDVLPLFFYQAKFLQAALGASRCLNIPLTQFKPVDVAPFKDNDSLTEEAATINHETPFAVVKDDSAYGPARGLPVFGARHRVFAGSLAWDLFPPPVTGPTEVFGDRFEMMRRDNARVLDKENWWRGTLDWVDRSFTFYGSVHREISEELTSLRGKFHESLTRDARQPSDGADHNERCLKRHEAASRWAMTRSNFRMGVSDDRHPLTLLKLSSRDMGTPTRGIMDGLQAAAQGSLHQQICHACMSTEVDSLDPILRCKRCEVLVHKSCYGLHAPMHTDGESWFCKRCAFEKRQARAAALSPGSTTCVVCGLMGGALKQDDCNRWVHSFCAVLLQRAPSLNAIRKAESWSLESCDGTCNICRDIKPSNELFKLFPPARQRLVCTPQHCAGSSYLLRCQHAGCEYTCHPMCGWLQGLHFVVGSDDSIPLEFSGTPDICFPRLTVDFCCPRHSPGRDLESISRVRMLRYTPLECKSMPSSPVPASKNVSLDETTVSWNWMRYLQSEEEWFVKTHHVESRKGLCDVCLKSELVTENSTEGLLECSKCGTTFHWSCACEPAGKRRRRKDFVCDGCKIEGSTCVFCPLDTGFVKACSRVRVVKDEELFELWTAYRRILSEIFEAEGAEDPRISFEAMMKTLIGVNKVVRSEALAVAHPTCCLYAPDVHLTEKGFTGWMQALVDSKRVWLQELVQRLEATKGEIVRELHQSHYSFQVMLSRLKPASCAICKSCRGLLLPCSADRCICVLHARCGELSGCRVECSSEAGVLKPLYYCPEHSSLEAHRSVAGMAFASLLGAMEEAKVLHEPPRVRLPKRRKVKGGYV
ncbi:MAG: hypothetical protein KVP17_004330 [Porospora cf. gigantea B]|uniref:uncharacterized protein n=2 Tax=Porospora cf. gigantea B TaxID=2853592 RepID=UPI0035719978|nr:MAG: hypothetical protein KVP17_004330 [Porospora cf. gigantea B]